MKQLNKTGFIILLSLAGVYLLLCTIPKPFSGQTTKVDFQVYWAATYLLSKSENFSDPEQLFELQHELTGWDEETPQSRMTWNPPWLLAFLLPLTWLPFERASWVWFVNNILMVLGSVVLLWQLYAQTAKTQLRVWLGIVLAFLFIPTLTTLFIGQISTLILSGLVGFWYCWRREWAVPAGIFLALTTIKPHLVYLALPILLLELLGQRQWRILATFGLTLFLGTLVVFSLRPTFLGEYLTTFLWGNVSQRTVPTLGFALAQLTGQSQFRFMALLILPIVLLVWERVRRRGPTDWHVWLPILVILSVITAPYGWSFDQVVLLVAVQPIMVWLVAGELGRVPAGIILLLYLVINALAFNQRLQGVRDDAFFWFPIAIGGLYLLSMAQRSRLHRR